MKPRRNNTPMRHLALALLAFTTSCRSPERLTVFAAASLGPALARLEVGFEAAHPGVDVQVELSGSKVAVAKVTDQERQADVVASADADLLDALLPARAAFVLEFAANA